MVGIYPGGRGGRRRKVMERGGGGVKDKGDEKSEVVGWDV